MNSGEFQGAFNNMRAIAVAVAPIVYGRSYAALTGRRLAPAATDAGGGGDGGGDALPEGFEKLWSDEHKRHYYHDTAARKT